MATNLDLDDQLIEKAKKLGGHRSKKEAVTEALRAYIARYKQKALIADFGKIDFDSSYSYKAQRKKT